ncbi:MAG TPA: molybdenum cofactor guanylyltransferase [Geobacteraceae bacterium]|nr:molybdenum cofactor guanylyltransferase [Geobacteraceae bacterium]
MGEDKAISDMTAVILAGGNSTRMMSNKAMLPYRGERFIERIHRQMASIFPEVMVVTNTPELYRFLSFRTVSDMNPGKCTLAGIHAGLVDGATRTIFVVACDMPDLDEMLVRHIASRAGQGNVVIPERTCRSATSTRPRNISG